MQILGKTSEMQQRHCVSLVYLYGMYNNKYRMYIYNQKYIHTMFICVERCAIFNYELFEFYMLWRRSCSTKQQENIWKIHLTDKDGWACRRRPSAFIYEHAHFFRYTLEVKKVVQNICMVFF